jgi:hypothetical protein
MTVWQPSRASAGREQSTGDANSGRRPDHERHRLVLAISLADAKEKYEPCKVCNPPQ